MTPLTLPSQTTLESRVTVGPGVPVWTYSDYWGTYVSVFDLTEPHDDLLIRAVSTVETEPFAGVPAAGPRRWPELRQHGRGGRLLEFVLPTALTTVTEEISDAAIADIGAGGPDEAAAAISARVHEHVTYLPGATGVRTNAQEAWDKGQGVCQDMAQIAVSLLRAAGCPPATSPATSTPTRRRSPAARRAASRTPGSSTGPAVDRARPHQRRPRRRAARRRRPRPRLRRRPAAQGHLPRPARERHAGHGRGHPPRLKAEQDQIRVSNGRVAPHPSSTHSPHDGRPPSRPCSVTMETAAAPARSEPGLHPRWIRCRGQGSPTPRFPGSSLARSGRGAWGLAEGTPSDQGPCPQAGDQGANGRHRRALHRRRPRPRRRRTHRPTRHRSARATHLCATASVERPPLNPPPPDPPRVESARRIGAAEPAEPTVAKPTPPEAQPPNSPRRGGIGHRSWACRDPAGALAEVIVCAGRTLTAPSARLQIQIEHRSRPRPG